MRGRGPGSSQWAEGFGDYAEILYDEKYHKPVAKIFDYLEQGSGRSLRWFRKEWLERRGVPGIRLKSDIQEKRNGYLITCTLEQQGNLYHLPVDIGIETDKGMRIEKAHLKRMQTTVSFQSKDKPKRVLLDPYDCVIMRKVQGTSKGTS